MRLYEVENVRSTQYWYHITKQSNVKSILEKGLNPHYSQSSLDAIFLACDKYTALNYHDHHMSGETYIVLKIDGNGLDEKLLGPDNYEFQDILDNEDEDSPYYGMHYSDLTWEDSAKLQCQVAYYGVIPPKYIEVMQS